MGLGPQVRIISKPAIKKDILILEKRLWPEGFKPEPIKKAVVQAPHRSPKILPEEHGIPGHWGGCVQFGSWCYRCLRSNEWRGASRAWLLHATVWAYLRSLCCFWLCCERGDQLQWWGRWGPHWTFRGAFCCRLPGHRCKTSTVAGFASSHFPNDSEDSPYTSAWIKMPFTSSFPFGDPVLCSWDSFTPEAQKAFELDFTIIDICILLKDLKYHRIIVLIWW